MAFSRRLEGHPYLSVNPFVSQPLWLALPTVRIPRNRLAPASSSQANAPSSPRPPFPFPFSFPLSFSFSLPLPSLVCPFLGFPSSFPFSSHLPWNSRSSCSCPCPCPCPPYPSTFWLRIAFFAPERSIVGCRTFRCDLLKRVLFTFCRWVVS